MIKEIMMAISRVIAAMTKKNNDPWKPDRDSGDDGDWGWGDDNTQTDEEELWDELRI